MKYKIYRLVDQYSNDIDSNITSLSRMIIEDQFLNDIEYHSFNDAINEIKNCGEIDIEYTVLPIIKL